MAPKKTAKTPKNAPVSGTVGAVGGSMTNNPGPKLLLEWSEFGGEVTITGGENGRKLVGVIRHGRIEDCRGALFLAEGEWNRVNAAICGEVAKARA